MSMAKLNSSEEISIPFQSLSKLRHWVEGMGYRGWDPYDALRSPILRKLSLGLKWPRIAIIQAMKHSPVNLRPLLLVPKGYNPKGLGLFLWGYTRLFSINGDEEARTRAYQLVDMLSACRTETQHGAGWGYNFDWQSRAFFVPKGTPTIVNTAFIGHALIDAARTFGDDRFLELAMPARDFILYDLNRTSNGDTFCFSYTPIDRLVVHNASLLGASLLIRLYQLDPHEESREAALAALSWSIEHQRDDGSWWYAETDYQQWIDSFHTGFNLQAIRYFLDLGEGMEFRRAYEKGVEFYAKNFFGPDGIAWYYHDRLAPEDIHSYAQAIVFFSRPDSGYCDLANRLVHTMIERFQTEEGWFCFQRRWGRPIRIPYIRWAQAWAFHALTAWLEARRV